MQDAQRLAVFRFGKPDIQLVLNDALDGVAHPPRSGQCPVVLATDDGDEIWCGEQDDFMWAFELRRNLGERNMGRMSHGHANLLAGLAAASFPTPSWDSESFPTTIAWLMVDFGSAGGAFKIMQARGAMRSIVGLFFDAATFLRTTGIWRSTENGGLAVMLLNPLFAPSSKERNEEANKFIEQVRSCAKFLAQTFDQESVGVVVQKPDGNNRVAFVGQDAQTQDILMPVETRATLAKIYGEVRGRHRYGKDKLTEWGD